MAEPPIPPGSLQTATMGTQPPFDHEKDTTHDELSTTDFGADDNQPLQQSAQPTSVPKTSSPLAKMAAALFAALKRGEDHESLTTRTSSLSTREITSPDSETSPIQSITQISPQVSPAATSHTANIANKPSPCVDPSTSQTGRNNRSFEQRAANLTRLRTITLTHRDFVDAIADQLPDLKMKLDWLEALKFDTGYVKYTNQAEAIVNKVLTTTFNGNNTTAPIDMRNYKTLDAYGLWSGEPSTIEELAMTIYKNDKFTAWKRVNPPAQKRLSTPALEAKLKQEHQDRRFGVAGYERNWSHAADEMYFQLVLQKLETRMAMFNAQARSTGGIIGMANPPPSANSLFSQFDGINFLTMRNHFSLALDEVMQYLTPQSSRQPVENITEHEWSSLRALVRDEIRLMFVYAKTEPWTEYIQLVTEAKLDIEGKNLDLLMSKIDKKWWNYRTRGTINEPGAVFIKYLGALLPNGSSKQELRVWLHHTAEQFWAELIDSSDFNRVEQEYYFLSSAEVVVRIPDALSEENVPGWMKLKDEAHDGFSIRRGEWTESDLATMLIHPSGRLASRTCAQAGSWISGARSSKEDGHRP